MNKQAEPLYEDSQVLVESFTFECQTCVDPGTQTATLVLVKQPFGMHLILSAWEGECLWTWMMTGGHAVHVLLIDQPVDSPIEILRIEFRPGVDESAKRTCDEYHEFDLHDEEIDAKVLDLFCSMLHEDLAPVFREKYLDLVGS